MNQIGQIIDFFSNKKILILGFGREGKSTYKFLRKYLPLQHLTIADKNFIEFVDPNVTLKLGNDYMEHLNKYDLIVKSPGIEMNPKEFPFDPHRITSQTALFLKHFKKQTIGITGTKGKSTTASLIFHILQNTRTNTLLGGNIGIPLFDLIDHIDHETIIVSEFSAHQLEYLQDSPHITIFLNLYQEHLDYFKSFESYGKAKWNICKFQSKEDLFIYNMDDESILSEKYFKNHSSLNYQFSRFEIPENGAIADNDNIVTYKDHLLKNVYPITAFQNIPGKHNFYNIMAAIITCELLQIDTPEIIKHISTFQGLEHRIEYVGYYHGINFYNDSISTIPQATISALEALVNVDTLILGGFDRGIDYTSLYQYLNHHSVSNIIFTGPAGKRMLLEWTSKSEIKQNVYTASHFDEVIEYCIQKTRYNGKCLLSPAASSYDEFKNFEERGSYFKNKIKE
ncbi:MAG TPA: UDP-N-acetylmuramoyl-L-alanine--D-glutamate ligase [Bacteroidales bacterium]|nr:UDP-N-acetylmuramoyl-L-alanine--D-glutamate ligase [Bacteroidales bacterium]